MPPTVSRCSANTVSEPTGCLFFVISTKGSSGSIGPAARTISGFCTPGLKRTGPSFMWKRRLNDTRSSDASTNSSAAGDTPALAETMTSTSRSRSISGYFTAASGSVPCFAAACSLNTRARSPEKSGPVWVCVAVIAMWVAGMPVRDAASARTSLVRDCGTLITSHTTSAIFVSPC